MVLENRVLEMDELGMFFPPRLDQKEGIHPSSARRIPEPSKRKEPGFRATTELHVASYSRKHVWELQTPALFQRERVLMSLPTCLG